jgi:hypothetical protein
MQFLPSLINPKALKYIVPIFAVVEIFCHLPVHIGSDYDSCLDII